VGPSARPQTRGTAPRVDSRSRTPSRGGGPVEGLSLSSAVAARRTALRLPEDLPLVSWRRIGRQINLIGDSSQWWLADWLVYGQARFPDRYKQAVAETSLEYQTLRNYAWVARRFEMSRRRDKVSFQHHAEVAALPEPDQDLWLNRAERLGWSLSELRRQLRTARSNAVEGRSATAELTAEPTAELTAEPTAELTAELTAESETAQQVGIAVTLKLCIPLDKKNRWQAAANTSNQELAQWLVSIADEATEDRDNDGGDGDHGNGRDNSNGKVDAKPA
jgi:hypothetical protein